MTSRRHPSTLSRRAVLTAAAAMGVTGLGEAVAASPSPLATTRSGTVRGVLEDGVRIFRGVPYGEPTGGKARFLPPQPVKAWTGVRDALAWGQRAPQLLPGGGGAFTEYDLARRAEPEGEDCLVLNVYAPAGKARAPRPVMVWLHGGGFALGSGGPGAEGDGLARREDVVVVTINHRLNLFGFLDLSSLDPRYATSGQNGMLDIDLALRWVRDNIAGFGGDPSKVTIFGQSGGGAKVSMVMAMPRSKGLYHRAIAQSGAVVAALTPAESRALAQDLLAHLKVGVDGLADVPAADLLAAMAAIGAIGGPGSTRSNFGPVIDDRILPAAPFDPRNPGPGAHVPMMVGYMREDTKMFFGHGSDFANLPQPAAVAMVGRALHLDAPGAQALYDGFHAARPDLSPAQLLIEITTQQMFGYSAWLVAERRAAGQAAPTYLYRCDWRRPGPEGDRIGAAHGEEVRLLLGHLVPPTDPAETARTEHMRNILMATWASFARTGRPQDADLPAWPAYGLGRRTQMVLDERPHLAAASTPAGMALVARLPAFHP